MSSATVSASTTQNQNQHNPINITQLKSDIEHMLQRRHHACRHVLNTLTEKGAFWLNSVHVCKEDVAKVMAALSEVEREV